jgi:hypothetical protein
LDSEAAPAFAKVLANRRRAGYVEAPRRSSIRSKNDDLIYERPS